MNMVLSILRRCQVTGTLQFEQRHADWAAEFSEAWKSWKKSKLRIFLHGALCHHSLSGTRLLCFSGWDGSVTQWWGICSALNSPLLLMPSVWCRLIFQKFSVSLKDRVSFSINNSASWGVSIDIPSCILFEKGCKQIVSHKPPACIKHFLLLEWDCWFSPGSALGVLFSCLKSQSLIVFQMFPCL